MLDPKNIPIIDPNETLARFVLYSGHVKTSDNSVRPDAFMPPAVGGLSVTRHRGATDGEIWNEARRVAVVRTRTLYGRADTSVSAYVSEGLRAVSDPDLPWNPNHTNILDWPTEKAAIKLAALEIASKSAYLPVP